MTVIVQWLRESIKTVEWYTIKAELYELYLNKDVKNCFFSTIENIDEIGKSTETQTLLNQHK